MQRQIIKFFVLISIIFILGIFFIGLNKSSIYDTRNEVGKYISKINLKNFKNNGIITEDDLKNSSYILINFWASWCSPCRKEHPFLLKLNQIKNIKLVGVNFKDKKDNADQFLNNLGNPYHILAIDDLGKQSVNFGVYGIPESILLDKDLKILKKFIGPISKKDYEEIKEILGNL